MSEDDVNKILGRWSEYMDTCRDVPAARYFPDFNWPCTRTECGEFFIEKSRKGDLPEHYKDEAKVYIMTILKDYPFQLWAELSLPMWHRFLDVWNDTQSFRKAMNVI